MSSFCKTYEGEAFSYATAGRDYADTMNDAAVVFEVGGELSRADKAVAKMQELCQEVPELAEHVAKLGITFPE